MSTAVSPLAPTDVPDMPVISGVKLATAAAGIRYKGRTDVLLAVMDKGTAVAGVFTKSKCPSAPVEWCRAKLKGGRARALVVNSGNANAFTGKTGRQATMLTADIAARALGCGPGEVFLASTGVIGEPLDATKFNGVLGALAEQAAPEGLHQGLPRRACRSRRAGGAGRRRRAQAGRDHRRGRGVESFRAQDCDVGGEFAAGEDRDRRRGRQLGPRGDGGRQGRRTRQSRQALDLVQRHPRRQPWRARSIL